MLALAHDYRVMNSDKGLVFLSEIDINIPLVHFVFFTAAVHAEALRYVSGARNECSGADEAIEACLQGYGAPG